MKECVTQISGADLTCADNNDAIFVDNGTFESEGHVPNWSCSRHPRTGFPSDRDHGCFVNEAGLSNLPDWSLDQGALDDWDTFNTVVSVSGMATIIEGTEYYMQTYFWAWENDTSMLGLDFKAVGQIGAPWAGFIFSLDTRTLVSKPYLPIDVN